MKFRVELKLRLRTIRLVLTNVNSNQLIKLLRKRLSQVLVPIYHLDDLLSTKKSAFELSHFSQRSIKIFCLVCHSSNEILDNNDRSILTKMKSLGYKTILITNISHFEAEFADYIVPKPSYGRDLASLRDLARTLSGSNCEKIELFFMNNSIAWDVEALGKQIARMKRLPANCLVFPTSSKYPFFHVQPYFIYSNLEGAAIKKFSSSFEWIKNWHLKRSIIYFGEYRILKSLVNQDWAFKILAPYEEVLISENVFRDLNGEPQLQAKSIYYNPTQHMWRALPSFGVWVVKKSLVSKNPTGVENPPKTVDGALETLNFIHKSS